jgi:hypothetical protein
MRRQTEGASNLAPKPQRLSSIGRMKLVIPVSEQDPAMLGNLRTGWGGAPLTSRAWAAAMYPSSQALCLDPHPTIKLTCGAAPRAILN